MVNPERGEVALKVGDKDYVLRFSANALCNLEDALGGMPIMQITDQLSDATRLSIKVVRALMWAGLQEFQPKITINQAGDIVEKLTMAKAYVALALAFQKAFPKPDPQQPDSQQEAAGTGPASEEAGSNLVTIRSNSGG